MRNLNDKELAIVCGGADSGGTTSDKVADTCKGLPDSTNVTISTSHSADLGGTVAGFGGTSNASNGTSVTVNCGDFRNGQAQGGSGAPAPSSST